MSISKIRTGIKKLTSVLTNCRKQIRINFEDDNLLLAPVYFIEVLKTIREFLPAAAFYAENGLDYTLLNEKTLAALIEAGFEQFNLSLGSLHKNSAHYENRELRRTIATLAQKVRA